MVPSVTIRRCCWLLAVTTVCAGLSAGDVKPTGESKSFSTAKSLGDSKTATESKTSPGSFDQETFSEPYRTIQVATTDLGIVREVLVREGESVEVDQPLVKLDDELVKASLAIAKQNLESRGALTSAEAELRLQTARLAKIEMLARDGFARADELERARSDQEVAAARVLTAQEILQVRQREFDKTQIELERRTVKSPIQGVVSKRHREVGEFVAPTDPVLITVVQLDPLLATFSLKPAQASQLSAGLPVQVQFASQEQPVKGEVELVSPVTEARSGTVRVKVRIPNPQRACRSGDRCVLLVPDRTATPQAASNDRAKSPTTTKPLR